MISAYQNHILKTETVFRCLHKSDWIYNFKLNAQPQNILETEGMSFIHLECWDKPYCIFEKLQILQECHKCLFKPLNTIKMIELFYFERKRGINIFYCNLNDELLPYQMSQHYKLCTVN